MDALVRDLTRGYVNVNIVAGRNGDAPMRLFSSTGRELALVKYDEAIPLLDTVLDQWRFRQIREQDLSEAEIDAVLGMMRLPYSFTSRRVVSSTSPRRRRRRSRSPRRR